MDTNIYTERYWYSYRGVKYDIKLCKGFYFVICEIEKKKYISSSLQSLMRKIEERQQYNTMIQAYTNISLYSTLLHK